jgi:hypothetical protein
MKPALLAVIGHEPDRLSPAGRFQRRVRHRS